MSFPRYPEYKDSGVEWLGKVPAHWGVSQSRRMFAVRSEPALASDKMLTASQKYGVLYQSDFVAREGRRVVEVILGIASLKHVEPDDFIISMRSFQGGIEWCKLRGSTSFHYVMLKPMKHVHPPFFAHLLKSTLYVQALRTTTDLIRDGQELRYSNFAQVDLPLVPMEEQAAIAKFLDRETAKIDALVAEQEKLIALLREKRQAVISHAVTKGLDPTAPMKDSGVEWLGEVPAHWIAMSIKYALKGIVDTEHKTAPFFDDGEYLVVRTSNIKDGKLVLEGARYTNKEGFDEWTKRGVPQPGDIIFTREAPAGEACIVPAGVDLCLGQRTVLMQVDSSRLLAPFALWSIYGGVAVEFIELLSQGSTVAHFNMSDIGQIPLLLPPRDEQQEIVEHLHTRTTEFDALIDAAQSLISLFQERRTALISAAVTGQIDVRGLAPARPA